MVPFPSILPALHLTEPLAYDRHEHHLFQTTSFIFPA
jgi:hypothetical protein